MIYRLLALLATVVLVVGVVLLSAPQHGPVAPATVGAPAQEPGYSARDARLVETGADGRPLYTLDAAQIRQQPDQHLVRLERVRLGLRDASGDQWTADADQGELGQDSGVVQLEGSVHVAGVLPGMQDEARISTEHLSFDTHTQIASTRDPVTLLMSGRTVNALGLVANLKEGRVQLESAVHGSFLP